MIFTANVRFCSPGDGWRRQRVAAVAVDDKQLAARAVFPSQPDARAEGVGSALYWIRLLMTIRGVGVTMKRELRRREVKSPNGRSTQLSVMPGSTANCGRIATRPV